MNSPTKLIVAIVAALVVILGIRIGISAMSKPDDQKLIQAALKESIEASKEGRPGGVLDLLSDNLKFNSQDLTVNKSQIARFIHDNKPDVEVKDQKALVTGDEARIVSPVELTLGPFGHRTMNEVTLVFNKEAAREFLIVPTHRWRLVDVRVPDTALTDMLFQ